MYHKLVRLTLLHCHPQLREKMAALKARKAEMEEGNSSSDEEEPDGEKKEDVEAGGGWEVVQ